MPSRYPTSSTRMCILVAAIGEGDHAELPSSSGCGSLMSCRSGPAFQQPPVNGKPWIWCMTLSAESPSLDRWSLWYLSPLCSREP